MALIVFHAPRGGSGTTFVAAQVAMALAEAGALVTAVDFARAGSLHCHFGLPLNHALPLLAPGQAGEVAQGVSLFRADAAHPDAAFVERLADDVFGLAADGVVIADVGAGDHALVGHLLAQARPQPIIEVVIVTASGEALAALPALLETVPGVGHAGGPGLGPRVFVQGMVDETRRFARHTATFLRALLGDRLIGQVRRDETVVEAVASLKPLVRYAEGSAAAADTLALAGRLQAMLDTMAARLDDAERHGLAQEVDLATGEALPGKSRAA